MGEQRVIYLAHPADQTVDDPDAQRRVWSNISEARRAAHANGMATFWPGGAFGNTGGIDVGPEIARINHSAIANATGMMAVLPVGWPTIGVPMEIERAVSGWNMPVAVISGAKSWELARPSLARRAKTFPETVEGIWEAAQWLSEQEPGVRVGDSLERRQPLPFKLDSGFSVVHSRLPTQANKDDAGFDLYVSRTTYCEPGFTDIPCDVRVELPEHLWGLITGRSSALRNRGLLVHTSVIDAGWRGTLFAGAWNMTSEMVVLEPGERVAQLIPMSNIARTLQPVEVQELSPGTRGENGFGSSGV